MRSIWKGAIQFGVVVIPSKLYTPTDDKRVGFHQYHKECGVRLQMPRWCPQCTRKVEAAEIDKGYEVGDQHIVMEESDFASLPLKSIKSVEITAFVPASDIDVRVYGDYYYLATEDTGAKAFALLYKGMEKAGLVAVGKLTYREREHLVALRPYDGILLCHLLHYADEIRDIGEIRSKVAVNLSERELQLADMLIGQMQGQFSHALYHDEYREALEKVIEAKMIGAPVVAQAEAKMAPVSDVADALLASLNMLGATEPKELVAAAPKGKSNGKKKAK